MWEAQFGDFANGAQAVIDQYLVAAESKWQRMNGLVLLLPHGYEGQGPEHSNARPERFLQLCAENNIQVCWPTTPAQYFHMLRRQMRRNFRKPLVVMTPKSLLRGGSGAVSTLAEFTDGGFRNVIDDPAISDKAARDKVSRVICCSGKVYYTLAAARAAKKLDHIAVVRIEQLYPFPAEEIRSVVASYGKAVELFWVQEEPRNMGAWRFVRNRLTESVPVHLAPVYVGRKPAASPATGSFRQHEIEEAALLAAALGDGPAGNGSTTLAGDSVFNIPRPAPKG
jgi:2-oxoglutarate dehydrogenase E1 component